MRTYGHTANFKLELDIVDAELVSKTLCPWMILLHNGGQSLWSRSLPEVVIGCARHFGSIFAAFKIAGVGDKGSPISVDSEVTEIVGVFRLDDRGQKWKQVLNLHVRYTATKMDMCVQLLGFGDLRCC